MSFEKKELKCCVCHAYLFDEDDKVFCPVCGAPHHRDCYNSLSHCGAEEFHGTEKQYDLVKAKEEAIKEDELKKPRSEFKETQRENINRNFRDTVTCKNCEIQYPALMNRCPKCGTINDSAYSGQNPFTHFDLLGGVPAEMDIGKGVTAKEASRFIFSNTHRFLPKFAGFNAGKKASWNWLCFLFPSVWFLSRKMYKIGILLTVLLTGFALLGFPLFEAIELLMPETAISPYQMTEILLQNFDSIGSAPLLLATVGSLGTILTRVLAAIFGDGAYYKHTIETVSEAKADTDIDFDEVCRKKGGISFMAILIGLFVVQYLPSIIIMFL
ncbi:MAG: RING finger protein [Oscillospiraceae bacterium]|nr:RING finger protein [Oscillospiraceae bacterium]